MRYIFYIVIAFILTSGLLTIEWFPIGAWISLSIILGLAYDSFYVSQENQVKLTKVLSDKFDILSHHCTRMSTLLSEIAENERPKKRFDSSKFKKN